MAEHVYIEKIADHIGKEVIIKGWLYAKTGKGKLQFLQVRDGTGVIQCVVFKKEVSPEAFDAALRLTQESSLVVTGRVRADERAPGIPGGIEIDVTDLEVIQFVTDEYPITLKEHGIDFLLSNRHLWIRSSRQWATLRVRATIIKAIRDWLDEHGFILMDTPILTPAACEGTTTLFETDYHGTPAYLSQSGQAIPGRLPPAGRISPPRFYAPNHTRHRQASRAAAGRSQTDPEGLSTRGRRPSSAA